MRGTFLLLFHSVRRKQSILQSSATFYILSIRFLLRKQLDSEIHLKVQKKFNQLAGYPVKKHHHTLNVNLTEVGRRNDAQSSSVITISLSGQTIKDYEMDIGQYGAV